MNADDRLIWRKPDVALRRAPFILSDDMKLRAEGMLPQAADVVKKAGSGRS